MIRRGIFFKKYRKNGNGYCNGFIVLFYTFVYQKKILLPVNNRNFLANQNNVEIIWKIILPNHRNLLRNNIFYTGIGFFGKKYVSYTLTI